MNDVTYGRIQDNRDAIIFLTTSDMVNKLAKYFKGK